MTPYEEALIKIQEKIKKDIAKRVGEGLQSRIGQYGTFQIGLPENGEPGFFFTTTPTPLEDIPTVNEILETVEEARKVVQMEQIKSYWKNKLGMNNLLTDVLSVDDNDDDVKPDVVVGE